MTALEPVAAPADLGRARILGIETSCDETAAAIVEGGTRILSSVVSSQVDLHARSTAAWSPRSPAAPTWSSWCR